jgi:hypothetical protein
LYKKTVIQNLLNPQAHSKFHASASMNKIDEVEPEPEVEQNKRMALSVAESTKVENV